MVRVYTCLLYTSGEIDRCRELGMDVVVTDHHRCDGRIPDCCAVVCHTREAETAHVSPKTQDHCVVSELPQAAASGKSLDCKKISGEPDTPRAVSLVRGVQLPDRKRHGAAFILPVSVSAMK